MKKTIAAAMMMIMIAILTVGCGTARPDTDMTPEHTVQTAPALVPSPTPEQTDNTDVATPTPEPSPTPQPEETACYIDGDGVRIRAEAGTQSEILCSLPHGTKLIRLEKNQEWSKVKYEQITGYVRNDLLSDSQPETRVVPQRLSAPKIVVKKAQRLLELWDGETLMGSYPIGLGWAPEGHKQIEGDGRTPEGEYYVCVRNSNSSFYLSLGLSYPNKADAQAALDDGRIDRRTYDQIAEAIDSKQRPPWRTPLGGAIMIHGYGSQSDWTAGCVAVDNDIMDILWAACRVGTPVIVEP